jgi:hypothetical protein
MTDCNCEACQRLKAECGSHYSWLSLKLLHRGWAGQRSPAEKAYQLAHATWAAKGPPTEAQKAVRDKFASTYVKKQR